MRNKSHLGLWRTGHGHPGSVLECDCAAPPPPQFRLPPPPRPPPTSLNESRKECEALRGELDACDALSLVNAQNHGAASSLLPSVALLALCLACLLALGAAVAALLLWKHKRKRHLLPCKGSGNQCPDSGMLASNGVIYEDLTNVRPRHLPPHLAPPPIELLDVRCSKASSLGFPLLGAASVFVCAPPLPPPPPPPLPPSAVLPPSAQQAAPQDVYNPVYEELSSGGSCREGEATDSEESMRARCPRDSDEGDESSLASLSSSDSSGAQAAVSHFPLKKRLGNSHRRLDGAFHEAILEVLGSGATPLANGYAPAQRNKAASVDRLLFRTEAHAPTLPSRLPVKIMSRSQWLALLVLFLAYLLLGATVFMHLESSWERQEREELADIRLNIHEVFLGLKQESMEIRQNLLSRVEEVCGKPLLNASKETPPRWNLYNSFFFAFTVVTTIGYGNLSPTTPWSRVFCIAFALLGIPLNGILLASLAEFFTQRLALRREKWKQQSGAPRSTQMILLVDGIFYLLPLFLIFILVPAGLFVALEGWSFLDAIYFAFVSLTTIGFGDFVAGMTSGGPWLWVYKILLVCWIVFGLGYLLMILGLITQALRSKRLRKLRRRLQLTTTASMPLRQFLNELYVIKLQRVYKQRGSCANSVGRRASQPCTRELNAEITNAGTNDAVVPTPVLARTHSDSDLNNIDMGATFPRNGDRQQEEVLGQLLRRWVRSTTVAEPEPSSSQEHDTEMGIRRRMSIPPGLVVEVGGPHPVDRRPSAFMRMLCDTSLADFLYALHQVESCGS